MVQCRDQAMLRYLKKHLDDSFIQLSIHYKKDFTKKVGIKLTPYAVITPWNGVLVLDQEGNTEVVLKNRTGC
jgi:hypothetical protein